MNSYVLLPQLPKLPPELEQVFWDTYRTPGKNTAKYSNEYVQRTVVVDGQAMQSAVSERKPITDENLLNWIKTNIVASWTECSVAVTNAKVGTEHGAHVDTSRTYILLYLLDAGGDDVTVSWYQEHGKPVDRTCDKGATVSDYSTMTAIDKVKVPTHTWALYNVMVLHGISNIMTDRIAIQIGLNEADLGSNLQQYTK
jgi:hypothetical protein